MFIKFIIAISMLLSVPVLANAATWSPCQGINSDFSIKYEEREDTLTGNAFTVCKFNNGTECESQEYDYGEGICKKGQYKQWVPSKKRREPDYWPVVENSYYEFIDTNGSWSRQPYTYSDIPASGRKSVRLRLELAIKNTNRLSDARDLVRMDIVVDGKNFKTNKIKEYYDITTNKASGDICIWGPACYNTYIVDIPISLQPKKTIFFAVNFKRELFESDYDNNVFRIVIDEKGNLDTRQPARIQNSQKTWISQILRLVCYFTRTQSFSVCPELD